MELRGDNGIAGRIISFNEVNERSGRGRRLEPQGGCDSGWELPAGRRLGGGVVEGELPWQERLLALLGSRDPGGCPKVRGCTEVGFHGKRTGVQSRRGMSPSKKSAAG